MKVVRDQGLGIREKKQSISPIPWLLAPNYLYGGI